MEQTVNLLILEDGEDMIAEWKERFPYLLKLAECPFLSSDTKKHFEPVSDNDQKIQQQEPLAIDKPPAEEPKTSPELEKLTSAMNSMFKQFTMLQKTIMQALEGKLENDDRKREAQRNFTKCAKTCQQVAISMKQTDLDALLLDLQNA